MNKNDYNYIFCIGAQKSGTSYLYHLLKQHAAIKFSDYKELHYFSSPLKRKKGVNLFLSYFKPDTDTIYFADFTPEYINNPDAVKYISNTFKEKAKIIYIMRDPVNRAFSNYYMRYSRSKEKRNFNDVINNILKKNKKNDMLYKGMYSEHLDLIYENFNEDQVMLIVFEKLIKNKEETMMKIEEFLNLNQIDFNFNVKSNSRKNDKVIGLGKFILRIPITVRRSLYSKSFLIEKILKSILKRSRKSIKNVQVLDNKTAALLSDYYKESNERARDEYRVDISDWQ